MAAEDFFQRWARPKPDAPPAPAVAVAAPSVAERAAGSAPERVLPTLADAGKLTHDSDFTPFLTQGVDESVRRAALKTLFSDPQFNIMDGLDTYVGDYNTFEPIGPDMLAMLTHAKGLLDPLSRFEKPLMQLIEKSLEPVLAAAPPAPDPVPGADAADITVSTNSTHSAPDHPA